MSTGKTAGYVVGDEYDSRRTPGIPATLSQHGFNLVTPKPFDEESIARVREWLAPAPKIRTPSGWYSYGLKHLAEAAFGTYVANGDCIAACILSGLVVKQERGSVRYGPHPNAMIGISARWVKKQIAELRKKNVRI